ncbi:MAG: hypothetical protein O7C59_07920, partial [Rickettsia endosymbiont of Ixodes persulcatus]|nr:hypothetical protein [Rickettsia endosymbiont of Ixodes persulcatus]
MRKVLLLADTGHPATAVQDHIKAITAYSNLHWFIENPLTCKVLYKLDLNYFDAVGVHYSIKIYKDYYLSGKFREKLKKYSGVKFVFLQDEYLFVDRARDNLVDMGIHIVFTLVDQVHMAQAYPHPELKKIKKITILTSYVSDSIKDISPCPFSERPIDIFYRSRKYPFSLGALAQERVAIAEGVKLRANEYNLKCDISIRESDRVYGQTWIYKMQSSRAVLGTESGASIWDFTGDIEKKTKQLLGKYPNIKFSTASRLFLAQYENKVHYATISPRLFEAASLRTAMILFPGKYSDILKKDEHYICLNKDFSNFKEVVGKLRDREYLTDLTNRTYQDIILSEKYHAKQLSSLVEKEILYFLSKVCSTANCISRSYVANKINKIKYRCLLKNYIYLFVSECKFIVNNFLIFIFDPQYRGIAKFNVLYQGIKR